MDASNAGGEFSRGATLKDLIELCRNLNQAGARYIVIGGFAVIHHGYFRGTNVIDLLVETSLQNLEKVKIALLALPDKAIKEIEPAEIAKYQVIRVADEVVVDLMTLACGISYEQAEADIEFKVLENVQIPFLKPGLLIKTKDTFRPVDQADRAYLQELIKRQKEDQEKKKPWWRW